jgi:amylovoran biosynthesis glycosyltransferase AmsD
MAMKYADQIVVLTKADMEEYKKQRGLRVPIQKIYNPAVSYSIPIPFESRGNYVIAAGNLGYAKNFEELIDIWKLTSQRVDISNWTLLICGQGENEGVIRKKIEGYGLHNVKMLGYCENIEDLYKKSKVYVMTSRHEGFPMVLLEAQKNGLPIISYDCFTGPSEIVMDDTNGFLVEYGNKEKFADALGKFLNDQAKMKQFSEQAYIDAKRFGIEKIVGEWMHLFKEMET